MSCNYADGLSPYEHKGVLGAPERFDNPETVQEKCEKLVEWIWKSKHVVLHTGAGISTSAGIPDFRGPNGVWTLEKQGKKPNIDISFTDAIPTKTHMAIKKLIDEKYVHYIISQNIDGLHLKSGVERKYIAELHGNMFIEQCNYCDSQFVRSSPTSTVGKKCLETDCKRRLRGRPCRGKLCDTILDWEHSLPDKDLEMSDYHSSVADLNICLGTTLQIVPSGNLPLKCKKYGGKLVIINLQPTKHVNIPIQAKCRVIEMYSNQDRKADLIINAYVDDVLEKLMKKLGLEIPEYTEKNDPTKTASQNIIPWNISSNDTKEIKGLYDSLCKSFKKRKLESKMNNVKIKKKEETKEEIIDITDDDDVIDLTI